MQLRKEKFISKASEKLAGIVESTLTSELSVLKEDIQSAKENMFFESKTYTNKHKADCASKGVKQF